MAQVAWHWKIRRTIRGVRMPLMGVKQEHRNKGVELAMLLEVMKALLPSRYDYLDSGWILESNPLIKISVSLGGQIYKTHRFYQKSLGGLALGDLAQGLSCRLRRRWRRHARRESALPASGAAPPPFIFRQRKRWRCPASSAKNWRSTA